MKAPKSERLKLEHDKVLSNYAFKFNLCRYCVGVKVATFLAVGGTHADTSKELYVNGDIYASVGLGRTSLTFIHHA